MFDGSLVAIVTPMFEDGAVDNESLERLIDFHSREGTDGIVIVGTTGESATLDAREHCEVIRQAVSFTNGRLPVIAGTGANSTTEAIELTQCAKDAGADACLLVTPYYNKPTQEGLVQHHLAIANAVDIPQILYNVPGRTACDMLPETVARLASHENITGVKEATGDIARVERILELTQQPFAIYSGDDATGLQAILAGAHGVISVTANVCPGDMQRMVKLAREGQADAASDINQRLDALHHKLFVESNPIPVKWALMEMGYIRSGIRLPMTWLSEQYHDEVRQAMQQAGITAGD